MTRYRHGPLEEAIAAANAWHRTPTPEPLDVLRARVVRESRAAADEALRIFAQAAQPTSKNSGPTCGLETQKESDVTHAHTE